MNAASAKSGERHSLLFLAATISKKAKYLNGIAEQKFAADGRRAAAQRPKSTDAIGDNRVGTRLAR